MTFHLLASYSLMASRSFMDCVPVSAASGTKGRDAYLVFRKLSVMHVLVPVFLHTPFSSSRKGLRRAEAWSAISFGSEGREATRAPLQSHSSSGPHRASSLVSVLPLRSMECWFVLSSLVWTPPRQALRWGRPPSRRPQGSWEWPSSWKDRCQGRIGVCATAIGLSEEG